MKVPKKVYRFRSLDDAILKREFDALKGSYLYAPSFPQMNDPMEAFYETGGFEDKYVDSVLSSSGQTIKDFYRLIESTVDQFGLVSFASTHEALPLWAYYADNFAGICLEFSTQHLSMGDFWNEKFRKVTYVRKPAPPIGFNDLGPTRLEEALISRLCRKRIEWSHENEWRFVTGGVGCKHYLEDALQCVYLGPRIEKENADEICNIFKRRPVTVMQGFVRGYELKFETLQTATPLEECERVGGGYFDPARDIFDEQELREFLGGAYNKLVEELRTIALQPNMEQFSGVGISTFHHGIIYLNVMYKLRNGHDVYRPMHFDKKMKVRIPTQN